MTPGVYPAGERKRAMQRARHVLPLEALAQKPAGGAGGSQWAQRLTGLFLRPDFKPEWLQDLRNTMKSGRSYSAVNKLMPESITKELVGIMQDAQKDFRRTQRTAFNVEYTEPDRGVRETRYIAKAHFSAGRAQQLVFAVARGARAAVQGVHRGNPGPQNPRPDPCVRV